MKKHFLIVTINDPVNYGNRLQNYALSTLISKYGKADTIKCELSISNKIRWLLCPLRNIYRHIKNTVRDVKTGNYLIVRRKQYNFTSFTKHFVDDSSYILAASVGLRPQKPVDGIILGSDQVWNYQWVSKGDLALRLGSFTPDNVPVISYAASIGVFEVSDDAKPVFQKYLPRLKAISVREDRAAELVKEMTGLDAKVVLDPTLMLQAGEWLKIARGFVPEGDRYVLTYFLGKPSDEQEITIQKYAKTHGCRIRRMLDLRDPETYVAGPQDFVELFSKAQYVFADSYHACCFSILFHRQFTVFNRAGMSGKRNMNSRMETLFRLFELDFVMMDDGLAPKIDYENVDRLLEQHRAESQAWLDKAMEE